jgi:DNA modification methylase
MPSDETAIHLWCGDATDLGWLPPESVHLVVTSPPYPMIPQWDAVFASQGASEFEAMHAVLDRAWAQCVRLLVPGGILVVNIGDAVRSLNGAFRLWPNHARVLEGAARLGLRPLPYALWKKPLNKPNAFLGSGFLPPNAYVTLDCEFLLIFRKGDLRRFPPHDTRRSLSRFTRAERDRWFSQIWTDVQGSRQSGPDGRTGAFPPEIPRRLVRMFSVVGDTVLDPFAGTATTLWVAADLGRRSWGVERDPTVHRRSVERGRALGYRVATE